MSSDAVDGFYLLGGFGSSSVAAVGFGFQRKGEGCAPG